MARDQGFASTRSPSLPLHSLHFSPCSTTFNRLFTVVYGGAISALCYYHLLSLLNSSSPASFLVSLSLFISDFILAFMWITTQTFRIRPVHRREYPENLKQLVDDSDLPRLEVFICTADPYKEPPMSVVNTALSVMAYDYPMEKISVYVSDDGGSALTLFALMEAARFAGHWLPFCRKNDVVERNPAAFFASNSYCDSETEKIKLMYEKMKVRVEAVVEKGQVGDGDDCDDGQDLHQHVAFHKWANSFTRQNHPTVIQVLLESGKNRDIDGGLLPNFIYVSRQKSVAVHHHFKAGALNVLLRVSAIMTNAPIILTLDCDTYSNDPKTPNRVLCYVMDPNLASNLGYVQFPQCFHGLSKNDIYAAENTRLYKLNPAGMDGLSGPSYLGTGCFFVRRAFFGGPSCLESPELHELSPDCAVDRPIQSQGVLDLAHHVAGCDYESGTKWGSKIGIRYGSLVEDHFTGYRMHFEGWNSIFCNPNRPAFYGDAPICLLDTLIQLKRWAIGLLEIAFSKYSPVTFGVRYMGIMGLSYAHNQFWAIWFIPVTVYAFIPQLALIHGISIFPKVSDPWFLLYAFLFLGAYGQDLLDFMLIGTTFRKWWSNQRMWNMRAICSFIFGFVEFVLKTWGISTSSFNVTSKVVDQEQGKRYERELFEFGVSSPLFVPIAMVATINLGCFGIGLVRILSGCKWEEVFVQMFIAGFAIVNCWPVYEAMVLRGDRGKMPPKITIISMFLCLLLISAASFFK